MTDDAQFYTYNSAAESCFNCVSRVTMDKSQIAN